MGDGIAHLATLYLAGSRCEAWKVGPSPDPLPSPESRLGMGSG